MELPGWCIRCCLYFADCDLCAKIRNRQCYGNGFGRADCGSGVDRSLGFVTNACSSDQLAESGGLAINGGRGVPGQKVLAGVVNTGLAGAAG